ncbi:Hint domain-containing homing endonuclease [Paenibacillus sp. TH7-28]
MSSSSATTQPRLFGDTDLDRAVERLFAALPNLGTNETGAMARRVLVNRMKGATPGRATTPYIGVQGKKFIDIFFPHYSPMDYQGSVTNVTGLRDDFWSGLSVAVLCDAMWNITSDLRPQLRIERIRQTIAASMNRIYGSATSWYTYMLYQIGVRSELAAIPVSRYPEAVTIYVNALRNPAWIQAKIVQYESGNWANRDWELYHHWVKLAALGALDPVIDETIQYLVSRQLPVPDEVRSGAWRTYRRWMSGDIGWGDIRGEATAGILQEECYVYGGVPSCMKESNSFEFTANSQPGNTYRQTPSSSCFERGTLVLMADGSRRPIEEVKLGQTVMTPDGPKPVLLVSTPLRARRQLYRFENCGFRFAATHPFVNYRSLRDSTQPTYLCADPLALINTVPTLSSFGVASLREAEGELCRYAEGGGISGLPVPPITGSTDEDESEVLYDLIVDFSPSGRSEYFAGDVNLMVLASSEIPRFNSSPEGSHAILAMLQGSADAVLKAMEPVPDQDFADVLHVALTAVSQGLLPAVLHELQCEASGETGNGVPGNSQAAASADTALEAREELNVLNALEARVMDTLETKVLDALGYFAEGDGPDSVYNGRMGTLYDLLAAQFGMPFIAAIDLGWRNMTKLDEALATMLAVTVYALELDGAFRLPQGVPLELRCTLSSGGAGSGSGASFENALPGFKASDVFCHTFDQSIYFDMWRPPADDAPWNLRFQLVDGSTGEPAGATGLLPLPNSLGDELRVMKALVQGKDGNPCGQITFDARPLNDLLYARETAARGEWTPEKKHILAAAFGPKAAEYLKRNISSALLLFGNNANAQAGRIFPPLPTPKS